MSRSRGATCPQALKVTCPECGAGPMEWCWSLTDVDKESIDKHPHLYRHARKLEGSGVYLLERPSKHIHAARQKRSKVSNVRWFDVKRESSRYKSRKKDPLVSLVLRGYSKKIDVIRVIRNLFGVSLTEAKAAADKAPSIIRDGLTEEQAEVAMKKLREVGASVEIKEGSEYEQ